MRAAVDESQPRGAQFATATGNVDKNAERACVDKGEVREINRKPLRGHVGR